MTPLQDGDTVVLWIAERLVLGVILMQTTVSVRWQTVIPREIRQKLAIEPNSKLDWELKDGFAQVRAIPADPVRASLGLLEGRDLTTESLLEERRRERSRERGTG